MITRQQEWAQKAVEKVKSMKESDEESDYKSFCKSFPSMIHNCGLCQALAFADAKKNDNYLKHLKYVLNNPELLEQSRAVDILEYQKLTRDTISAATWLKRYAEAFLKSDEDEDENEDGGVQNASM